MSSLSEIFGWNKTSETSELPDIFPVPITQGDFVGTDITAIYAKILTDVLERTDGLSDDQVALMWDSCVMSSSSEGLVTMLSKAMAEKGEIFLVFEKAVKVIRPATPNEQTQIRADYQKQGESSVGVFISFKTFKRSDMVKFYLGLEYCTVGSLYKSMNLAKAVQIKISELRASVSLADADSAKSQAKKIAESLSGGKDVMLDAKDLIETNVPDLTAVKESIAFIVQKLSFYLGMPDSYLTGIQTSGMGTTGENDMRAVERGLKGYYFSIVKPALEALLGVNVTYKSQDFRQIENASDILKTFTLVDDVLISQENKRRIINRLLGLKEDEQGDPAPKVVEPKIVPPKQIPGEKAAEA